ncbi:olfactory receptor 1G1-like [Ambystoma mexicanum]|uniref:olfactory receptor 1G1-like n=1 Tax=Ambystoma mexicanum TaxID=8296 RepID=UPI0037E75BE7
MAGANLTSADTFLIVGFMDVPQLLRLSLFTAFSLIYVLTLVTNIVVIATIYLNSNLHTPMFFFLANLSVIDIGYTSVIFPKMLVHFFQEGTHFSLTECLLQIYHLGFMMSTEFLLLTVMAYDRYVAICHPLRYMTIMNKEVCIRLAAASWLVGLLDSIPHVLLISKLSFCESHTINHFFCDLTSLMKLSCSDTGTIDILTYILVAIMTLLSFLLIITSYVNIISSILKMKSRGGQRKAFSTCATHITVVLLFNGSVCSTYMRPKYLMRENKVLSLLYVAVTPLFNPLIYSLSNTEFKNALKKTMTQMNNSKPF